MALSMSVLPGTAQASPGPATTISAATAAAAEPATSSTTLSLSDTDLVYGDPVTASVEVAVDGLPAAGSVAISAGGLTKTVALVDGTATATFTPDVTVGPHPVLARFTGGAGVEDSSGVQTYTVTPGPVTIRKTVPAVVFGAYSPIEIWVGRGDLGATGAVAVTIEGRREVLDLDHGRLVVSPSTEGRPGRHQVRLEYLGSDRLLTGSNEFSFTRKRAAGNGAVWTENSTYGTPAVLHFRGYSAGDTYIDPTGSVTVSYRGEKIATGRLRNGSVDIALPSRLLPGKRKLQLRYLGDVNYLPRDAATTQTVTKARSTVLVPKLKNGREGVKTTIPVEVAAAGGSPTGSVTVSWGKRVLAKKKLSKGRAKLVVPALPVGPRPLTIAYSGDAGRKGKTITRKLFVDPTPQGARSFGTGEFAVNRDIQPGLYRTDVPSGHRCTVERFHRKDRPAIGTRRDGGYSLIRVLSTDGWVTSDGCGTWNLVDDTPAWPIRKNTIPGNGTLLVGVDIQPGTYRTPVVENCNWHVLNNVLGVDRDTRYGGGERTATIVEGAFAFRSEGCTTWKKVS